MNYHSIAQRCINLFVEARKNRPRFYGSQTAPSDWSGTTNPSSNLKSTRGKKPGHGRSRVNPYPPISTPPPP